MSKGDVHDRWNHNQEGAEIQQVCPGGGALSTLDLRETCSEGSQIARKTTHPKRRHLHQE